MAKRRMMDMKIAKLNKNSAYKFFSTFLNSAIYQFEDKGKDLGLDHKRVLTNWYRMDLERFVPIQEKVIDNALNRAISDIYERQEDNNLVEFVKDRYLSESSGEKE